MKKKRKRRKKKLKREIILQKLAELGEATAVKLLDTLQGLGTFASYMMLPYHESYRKMRFGGSSTTSDIDAQDKAAFWSMLYKLKTEGLIKETGKKNLFITKTGKTYIWEKAIKPSWIKRYKPATNPSKNEITLVIFDIPQREHEKRDWLRSKLNMLGFRKLQRSVFFGNKLLPKEFLEDLHKFGILPYIHIFTVIRKGSLSEFLRRIGEHELAK